MRVAQSGDKKAVGSGVTISDTAFHGVREALFGCSLSFPVDICARVDDHRDAGLASRLTDGLNLFDLLTNFLEGPRSMARSVLEVQSDRSRGD